MQKINLGIIGCGHWGPNYVRNFSQMKDVFVKYVCDLSPVKLSHIKRLYPHITTILDYRRILKDKKVDAAVIATTAGSHFRLVKAALNANQHILVEKPIAININEAKELVRIARHKKRILMVGHTFKFNPGIKKLKEIIKNKELGRIFYIYSRRTNLGPLRRDVNAVWDLAPHDISILNYLLGGLPLSVSAWGQKYLPHNLEDVSFIMLTFRNKIMAHIHVSWLDPKKTREIVVVGSKKMAIFDDLNLEKPIVIYDKRVMKKKFRQNYDSFEEFQMIIRDGKATTPKVKKEEPLKLECRHFVESLRKHKKPLTDGKDGLEVLTVLSGIQKSLDKGGVRVSLQRSHR